MQLAVSMWLCVISIDSLWLKMMHCIWLLLFVTLLCWYSDVHLLIRYKSIRDCSFCWWYHFIVWWYIVILRCVKWSWLSLFTTYVLFYIITVTCVCGVMKCDTSDVTKRYWWCNDDWYYCYWYYLLLKLIRAGILSIIEKLYVCVFSSLFYSWSV